MILCFLAIFAHTSLIAQHQLAELRATSHIAVGKFIERYAVSLPQDPSTFQESPTSSTQIKEEMWHSNELEEVETDSSPEQDGKNITLVASIANEELRVSRRVIQAQPGQIIEIERDSDDIYLHSFEPQNAFISQDYRLIRVQAATKIIITYFSQMQIVDIVTTPTSIALDVLEEDEDPSDIDEVPAGVRIPQKPTPSAFAYAQSSIEYIKLRIQLVDDRSSHDDFYPISNIRVMIPGFDEPLISDEKGSIELPSVPRFSRIVLLMNDPLGRFRQHQYELHATSSEQIVLLRRESQLSVYEQVSGHTPNALLATACGFIVDSQGRPIPNIQVRSSLRAERVLYFDELGSPRSGSTSTNGRFCTLGVKPGPNAFYFYNAEQRLLHVAMSGLYSGYHLEESYTIDESVSHDLNLFSYAGAHEQLSSDPNLAYKMGPIDMSDVTAIGNIHHFYYVEDGKVRMDAGVHFHKGRSFVASQSAEFESSFHVLDQPSENEIRLFPRGFIEDIATLLGQNEYQSNLGSLFVEFSSNHNDVRVKLIDENNKQVSIASTYSQNPVHKSMFFNIDPGYYSIIVETPEGLWLAQDSVYIYNATHSVLHMHSQTQVISNSSSETNP